MPLDWKEIANRARTLLIEHKSRGKDFAKAFKQAKDCFPGLKADDGPCFILLRDFWYFKLHDLDEERWSQTVTTSFCTPLSGRNSRP